MRVRESAHLSGFTFRPRLEQGRVLLRGALDASPWQQVHSNIPL